MPLAALALLVGGFVLARPDRGIEPARTPTGTRAPAPLTGASPPPHRATPSPQTFGLSGLAAARTATTHFLADYLRPVSGHGSARLLDPAAPELRRDLRRHLLRTTPAQQTRPPAIRAIDITPQRIASVRAIATLQALGRAPYPLLRYLVRRGARWLVTRIGDA